MATVLIRVPDSLHRAIRFQHQNPRCAGVWEAEELQVSREGCGMKAAIPISGHCAAGV
ncbi:MAG: hypothetical protein ACO3JG_16000 [Luteolibacter sp.]